MFKIIDARILDKNAEYFGIEMEKLMDNAGNAVAKETLKLNPKKVLVLAGNGNNGGDGYTASISLLKNGVDVHAYKVKEPESPLCKKKFQIAKENGLKVDEKLNFDYDVIIDAMLGIGITNEPKEPYRSVIESLNSAGKFVISVDVPSGFPTNVSVKPSITVTMQFIKEGMNETNCGKIIVADVGFPVEIIESVGPGEFLAYNKNLPESHKGDNGIILAIGGSHLFYGAPLYMAKAASRMGPDLVFLFAPESIHAYLSGFQDMILRKCGYNFIEFNEEIKHLIEERDVTVSIGPGITKSREALENARKIIDFTIKTGRYIVIDADALQAIDENSDLNGQAVITPHRGEFKQTFNLDPSEENVRYIAKKINATVLLKGPIDIISDGEIIKKNKDFHHASMTRGGTGDILTGSVAGLMSKHIDPFHAAALASFIVGMAGKKTFHDKSYSYFTSEIIDNIPEIFKQFLGNE
ncbi:MAG: NAD(P)H-hydrate dehydratase [Thermoplasmata archaeon]|nr:NAD(P)H-hydrate dehydratase [Thermoplasmata archaeon]